MKKIVILSNTVGVVYKFKLELLKELKKMNYSVYLLAHNENEDSYLNEIKKIGINFINIKIDRRGKNIFKDINLFIEYIKFIIKINPEYIYTFTIKPNIYGGIISRILNKKYIVTITGLGTIFQKKNLVQILTKYIYKYSLKKSKKIFFENNENKIFFIEQGIINSNQGTVLPGSGVNIKRFYPMEKKENKNKIFIFIGRIMKEKGIEEYIKVSKMITEKIKDVEFWVVGTFEEIKYKDEIINSKSLKYKGVYQDIREVIKECDYLIQPSYHEGMSNVILEASAMGKIVLATNIPGCKEAIYNKNFLFEKNNVTSLKETILNILRISHKDYQDLAKEQREYIIENFSRNFVIRKNIEVLTK